MNKIKVALIGSSLLLLSACGGLQPVVSVNNHAYVDEFGDTTVKTMPELQKIFINAGNARGWSMKVKQPGEIIAMEQSRNLMAKIKITYDTKSYSIQYLDSKGLKYDADDKEIHPKYNQWINNLQKDIQKSISGYTCKQQLGGFVMGIAVQKEVCTKP